MKILFPVLIIVVAFGISGQPDSELTPAIAGPSNDIIISVDEWDVPFDERWSRDPHLAPDGTVWFVGQFTHYVGWFDPVTEEFGHHDLEDGAGPHSVDIHEEGTVWFTGFSSHQIGRLDESTGEITRYKMEDELLQGPHSLAFDGDGNFWFTAYSGNGIGHFNVTTGEIRSVEVPTEGSRPYGIVMDPEEVNRPWISLFGTNKLATVNPETMELEEVELPREETRPRRLNVTSDGNVWYGDFAEGQIGRYNPEDGSITEWEMPDGADSRPYGILTDHMDRLWIAASGLDPNKLYAFDARSEEFVASVEIESARGAIRNMDFDAENRAIWFGTDTGHIGRVIIE